MQQGFLSSALFAALLLSLAPATAYAGEAAKPFQIAQDDAPMPITPQARAGQPPSSGSGNSGGYSDPYGGSNGSNGPSYSNNGGGYGSNNGGSNNGGGYGSNNAGSGNGGGYGSNNGGSGNGGYSGGPPPQGQTAYGGGDDAGPGQPYTPAQPGPPPNANAPYVPPESQGQNTFSMDEIKAAGGHFFGRVSIDMASVIEYSFQRAGRPNGYILGEDAGGAFVAGLRYGEGTLYTKDAGNHHIYWQGPSIGYDFGGDGSKTMVLVYNLRGPADIFSTFAGINGSAYLVGGVGITYLSGDHVVLAPIHAGVGLRLGANVGYLKYTPYPTWNPF